MTGQEKYCLQGHNQYLHCSWNEFSSDYKSCPGDVLNCRELLLLESAGLIVFGLWDFTQVVGLSLREYTVCVHKVVANQLNPTEILIGTCDHEMTLADKFPD